MSKMEQHNSAAVLAEPEMGWPGCSRNSVAVRAEAELVEILEAVGPAVLVERPRERWDFDGVDVSPGGRRYYSWWCEERGTSYVWPADTYRVAASRRILTGKCRACGGPVRLVAGTWEHVGVTAEEQRASFWEDVIRPLWSWLTDPVAGLQAGYGLVPCGCTEEEVFPGCAVHYTPAQPAVEVEVVPTLRGGEVRRVVGVDPRRRLAVRR